MRQVCSVFLFLWIGCFAYGGPRVNNGGGGYLCLNENSGKAKWIRPIEAFEHSRIPDLRAGDRDAWQIYAEKRRYIDNNLPELSRLLKKHDVDLRGALKFSPLVFDTNLDSDVSTVARLFANAHCDPKQIRYVQIANYLIDGSLMISQPVWEDIAFREFDKAIILLHEIIYKVLRSEYEDPSSRRARALTGIVFSEMSPQEQRDQMAVWLNVPSDLSISFEETTALFPVKLWCWVRVAEYGSGPSKELGFAEWKDMPFEANEQKTIAGFNFRIQTNGIDGVPSLLEIVDSKTKVSSKRRDDLRTSFLFGKVVTHELTRNSGRETKAEIRCMNDNVTSDQK